MHAALWEALRQGLVERLDGSYKFVHDRVQEAAYSLIPRSIARRGALAHRSAALAAHTSPEKREETIFDIVNQLNRGVALITSREEREHLAELNLIAGKRAKASTAYVSALKYFIAGAALLGDDRWERRQRPGIRPGAGAGRMRVLTGELAAADERLTALSNRAARYRRARRGPPRACICT